ncbi:AcrR family transcriptional regulator [Sporomusaceae bacterium BoRhaA]|uniref:TetR/AcrR family transcriptional regulator n=1 Tax=Pelorhabdus rhamnosifermentans TaxID=2772457 RepID=UPI001C05EF6D|nr:TetR/AcrR family transcriptional regulator [Pelorhabdus rhamnosifermentans]MBU2700848.1 AcrR family transcriptional regulator [Pelorhabdus rhamnosifermentans]
MRERIMMGAVEEIREKGMKFTMSALARRVGVSKRSLYEHFESKEALVYSIIEAILEDANKKRLAVIADEQLTYQEKLKKVLTTQSTLFSPLDDKKCIEIKRFFCTRSIKKLDEIFEKQYLIVTDFLELGVKTREIRWVYLPVFEKMIRGTMNEIVDYQFLAENNVSVDKARDYMIDILIYGLIPHESNNIEINN